MLGSSALFVFPTGRLECLHTCLRRFSLLSFSIAQLAFHRYITLAFPPLSSNSIRTICLADLGFSRAAFRSERERWGIIDMHEQSTFTLEPFAKRSVGRH